ncbi:putative RNA methyltransferase [Podospora australis]|uniref:tRNA (uracil(54)-C(5))-methyltransferase n=1 Tax=Podospora australis TaxID=1536484 RepID=A0AAN6WYC9_9PEZI|nr:putative RNA methyltransferase [Podospora australis]
MLLGAIRILPRPSSSIFTPLIRSANQSHTTRRIWLTTTSSRFKMASTEAPTPAAPAPTLAPVAQDQDVDSYKSQTNNKRPFQNGNNNNNNNNNNNKYKNNRKPAKHRRKAKPVAEGSHEEVLLTDIQTLIAKLEADAPDSSESPDETPLPEQGSIIDVQVIDISSTGDGLARLVGSPSNHIYVVPFSVPGDVIKVKAYRPVPDHGYTAADFISVVTPSPLRDDSRIQCKYFSQCSGCQFQMLDYAEQLRLKRNTVIKAYKNFSQLDPSLVPEVLETIGSPLQYNYRTKLTPHFDGPKGNIPRKGAAAQKPHTSCPPIGFTPKTSRNVLDIEDCPIATPAVRQGLRDERKRMQAEYGNYVRGATILLRESTKRVPKSTSPSDPSAPSSSSLPPSETSVDPSSLPVAEPAGLKVESDTYTDYKTCITDNNATSTEFIDSFIFTNPAGSFFQNNNSILPPFTAYIRSHALPPPPSASSKLSPEVQQKPIKYLIDAYSGSGLFTITQSSLFPGGSVGIDIAEKSIAYARRNAELNGLSEDQCKFIAADAPELFKSVDKYNPDETVVVLDPPRKGCDASFLRQLLEYAPRRVLYVSCNVHTQARDVGVLVRGEVEGSSSSSAGAVTTEGGKKKKVRYEIESIRGFDFFPQTSHVEGVAVLNRVDEEA